MESEPGYLYARGNPIRYHDPSGYCPPDPYSPGPAICNDPWAPLREMWETGETYIKDTTFHLTEFQAYVSSSAFVYDVIASSEDLYPAGFQAVANAIVGSHLQQGDDGIIFGFSGGYSSLLQDKDAMSLQAIKEFIVAFNGTCFEATGQTGGVEFVYDFKHLERGVFGYSGNLSNVGNFMNAGVSTYIGKTRGFVNAGYDLGVSAYEGPFGSITLNLGHKKLPAGLVIIEAAPFKSDYTLNPRGVFATYYGVGVGGGAGTNPVSVDIAATNYALLPLGRYRYMLGLEHLVKYGFFENPFLEERGVYVSEQDIINLQKALTHRKTAAALMTAEIVQWAVLEPGLSGIAFQAIGELDSFKNDTSD